MTGSEKPSDVVAVVLTYRRERLATQVVRGLIDEEGFAPADVIVVVNGEGGLDDPDLAAQVQMEHLSSNLGPAGGFRAGLEAAAARGARWAYLCEDDVGLFELPTPRVHDVVRRIDAQPDAATIGGVVAYGRELDPRTGRTRPAVPDGETRDLVDVDAAAWGASLVRCEVADRGILPDASLFFGFEDFDFWYAMQRAGYRLMLDVPTARAVADRVFAEQRERQLVGARPVDAEEPWRRYYEARNFMVLRRRYGRAGWTRSHLLLTVRRAQLSPTWAHRRAAAHGLVDGLRGRTGRNDRYLRGAGERVVDERARAATPDRPERDRARPQRRVLQIITDNDRRGGQVFATDLHEALERQDVPVRTVALAPAANDAGLEHDVLGPSRRHPRTLLALRREIRASSVVIGHGSTTLPMCALAGLGTRTPFVYRQISEQLFWANTTGRRLRTRLALRTATRVVALWRGAAQVLTGTFGVHPDRITIVPNGVPVERCPPVDDAGRRRAKQRFGLDADRPVLLSIGAFAPEKGVDTLVRAMGEPALEDWQLLLVGAGPERARLERLGAGLPAGAVTLHGPVASGAEAIAAADVVGLTSRGGDSMPAVLIEAGMMGVPSVATPVEGIVDIVLDGETGALVPIDDAAATAAAVAEVGRHQETYGQRAQQHCLETFAIDQVARRWRSVIEAVAAVAPEQERGAG